MEGFARCTLCPRQCGADRTRGAGLCGAGSVPMVARAASHAWEEPCISGTRGSGTVFFSGCGLHCRICQNIEISAGGAGKALPPDALAEVFLCLSRKGVHNINLVTPTPWWPLLREAVKAARERGLSLPIVWNTSGYETLDAVAALRDAVDIWLTDLKFCDSALSEMIAGAPDYFDVATKAIAEMIRQSGPSVFDAEGLLLRGTVIRLLVLPGYRKDAIKILEWIAEKLPRDGFLLSLMSQYTPTAKARELPHLGRRLCSLEYSEVVDTAIALGLTRGYMQERSSAKEEYVPPFDLTGL